MKKKVEIEIGKDGERTYRGGDEEGKKYISVDYSGGNYGSGSPCSNEEQVKRAIEWAKKHIYEEGDMPVIKDYRIKLGNFIKAEKEVGGLWKADVTPSNDNKADVVASETLTKVLESSQKIKAILKINVSADGTWLITSDESMIGVGSGAIKDDRTMTMEEGLSQMEEWLREDGYTEFEQVVV